MSEIEIPLQELLEIAKTAAIEAGQEIISVYNSADFGVEMKSDNSPLTIADKRAHKVIVSFLEKTDFPILSEEGRDIGFDERKTWDIFWMVDPLDGTKEFVKRNGEFTVNIALIQNSIPVLGVVYCPVLKKLYYSMVGKGAYLIDRGEEASKIKVSGKSVDDADLKVVASRSHLNDDTRAFIEKLDNPDMVSMGSSLKLLAVAEGSADVYPRFAPTMEWDTAAAHAIVNESGGEVVIKDSNEQVTYNKENLLNPFFLVLSRKTDKINT